MRGFLFSRRSLGLTDPGGRLFISIEKGVMVVDQGRYPYPKTFVGWTWKDHPSMVSVDIMTMFEAQDFDPLSRIGSPMEQFDFMNELSIVATTRVMAAR